MRRCLTRQDGHARATMMYLLSFGVKNTDAPRRKIHAAWPAVLIDRPVWYPDLRFRSETTFEARTDIFPLRY